MSWSLVKRAFFVEQDGECVNIDIGVCSNCNGIHIPPSEASGCESKGKLETYEELMERYSKREGTIKVNFMEMMTFNEIKIKHRKLKLSLADQYVSLFKRISELTPETPLEDVDRMQEQVRAMINKTEEDLNDITDDKKFVEKIMKREKDGDNKN